VELYSRLSTMQVQAGWRHSCGEAVRRDAWRALGGQQPQASVRLARRPLLVARRLSGGVRREDEEPRLTDRDSPGSVAKQIVNQCDYLLASRASLLLLTLIVRHDHVNLRAAPSRTDINRVEPAVGVVAAAGRINEHLEAEGAARHSGGTRTGR
jgi:hypothetical protein